MKLKSTSPIFCCSKDWPELVSIFNKAMASISESKTYINNKWVELDTDIDYGPIIRYCLCRYINRHLAVSFSGLLNCERRFIEENDQLDLEKQSVKPMKQFKSNFMARMSHEIELA